MNDYEKLFRENQDAVNRFDIKCNSPATDDEIKALELKLNLKLPFDIVQFYKFSNGFETYDWLFRVVPIQEIITYKDELENKTFHFAEYMIYSDQWLIKLNGLESYEILNDNHKSEKLKIQTSSIYEFLEKYFLGGLFSELENNSFWDRLKNNNT